MQAKKNSSVKFTENGEVVLEIISENKLIEDFLQTLLEVYRYSPFTVHHYQIVLNNFARFLKLKGKILIEAVLKDVEDFILTLNLERSTIRNYIGNIKNFYDYLLENGIIEKNPVPKKLRKAFRNTEEQEKEIFREEEIGKIRKALENAPIMWRAITELFLSSGVRLKELLLLDIGDIDLKTRKIAVKHGKGGKSRITFMSSLAGDLLSQYLLTTRKIRSKNSNALFISKFRKRLSINSVGNFYRDLSKKLGFHIHPHKFRHTFASILQKVRADFVCIQKLLGHSTKLGITGKYIHPSEKDLFIEYSKAFK